MSAENTVVGLGVDVRIEPYPGAREELRGLFELAEDSPTELDSYLHAGRVLVARSGLDVLGHIQVVDTDRPGRVELKNMAVREAVQGRGVGARLVRAALDLAAAEAAHEMDDTAVTPKKHQIEWLLLGEHLARFLVQRQFGGVAADLWSRGEQFMVMMRPSSSP